MQIIANQLQITCKSLDNRRSVICSDLQRDLHVFLRVFSDTISQTYEKTRANHGLGSDLQCTWSYLHVFLLVFSHKISQLYVKTRAHHDLVSDLHCSWS